MANYTELLNSPKWQKKRLEILQRDEFKCCYCGDTETELHIHHLQYNGKPWQIENEHLITLCMDCHRLITFNKDLNVIKIIKHNYDDKLKSFYIKNKIDKSIFIQIIICSNGTYFTEVIFAKDGQGINNLISLNNG